MLAFVQLWFYLSLLFVNFFFFFKWSWFPNCCFPQSLFTCLNSSLFAALHYLQKTKNLELRCLPGLVFWDYCIWCETLLISLMLLGIWFCGSGKLQWILEQALIPGQSDLAKSQWSLQIENCRFWMECLIKKKEMHQMWNYHLEKIKIKLEIQSKEHMISEKAKGREKKCKSLPWEIESAKKLWFLWL